MLTLLLCISLLQVPVSASFFLHHTEATNQLHQFFKAPDPSSQKFKSIITAHPNACPDLLQTFLAHKRYEPVVIVSSNIPYGYPWYLSAATKTRYIFVENFEELDTTLRHMERNNIARSIGRFRIVFCEPLKEPINLNRTFELLLGHRLLNFVLVYNHGARALEVIGYNPFNNTVLNFTENFASVDLFPDKLSDLYGHTLKVSVCDDYPRNMYKDGDAFGSDLSLLKNILAHINATPQYVYHETFDGVIDDVQNYKTDFSFIGYFASNWLTHLWFTYPQYMDDVVIMVPQRGLIPYYWNVFLVYEPHALLALLVPSNLIMLAIYITKKLKQKEVDGVRTFMEVMVIGVSSPLPTLSKSTVPIKLILMSYVFYTFVVNGVYQTSLISAYVTPKKYKDINTLQELKEANFRIRIPADYGRQVPGDNLVKSQLVSDTISNVTASVISQDTSSAYAMPFSYAWESNIVAMKDAKKKRKLADFFGRPRFWLMRDILVPLHKVYLFPINSIYISKVNDLILKDREYSLTKAINYGLWKRRLRSLHAQNDSMVVLELSHMQMCFYLLLFGLCTSAVVFVVEVACLKMRSYLLARKVQSCSFNL